MNCDYSPYSLPTIDFVGGSTQELVFHTFFSQNKKPFDLSSCTASFALINFVNKNGSPLIAKPMEVSKSEDGDGTVTNVLRVVLLPEETVDLVGKFIYQITIQDISVASSVVIDSLILAALSENLRTISTKVSLIKQQRKSLRKDEDDEYDLFSEFGVRQCVWLQENPGCA